MAAKSTTKSVVLPGLVKGVSNADARGRAMVRSGEVARTPSAITPFAKPATTGAQIGFRVSPGSAAVASAQAKGANDRTKLAQGGAGRMLPAGPIRDEYMKRVLAPFQPPSSPGLVDAIFTRSDRAADTSTGAAQEASALVTVKQEAERATNLERELTNAKAEAARAVAFTTAAVNANDPVGARRGVMAARVARIKAQKTGLALVKSSATGGRAALAAGAVQALQRASNPSAVTGLRKFHASATRIPVPKTLTESPKAPVDTEELMEGPGGGASWPFGSNFSGLGGSADFVALAKAEQSAINTISRDAFVTSKRAQSALVTLFDEKMTPMRGLGFFGALGSMGATADTQSKINTASDTVSSLTALINKGYSLVGAITGKPAPAPAPSYTEQPSQQGGNENTATGSGGPWIPKKFLIAGGVGAVLLVGAAVFVLKD